MTSMRVTAAKEAEAIRIVAESRPNIGAIVSSREHEIGAGAEREIVELAGTELWKCGGGDHGGVVGGKRWRGEIHRARKYGSTGSDPQACVRSNTTRDNHGSRTYFVDADGGTAEQFFDD